MHKITHPAGAAPTLRRRGKPGVKKHISSRPRFLLMQRKEKKRKCDVIVQTTLARECVLEANGSVTV